MSGDPLDQVRAFLNEDDPSPDPVGDADTIFGQIAIAQHYVTTDRILEATRDSVNGKSLEETLLERGWITPDQSRDVRRRREKMTIAGGDRPSAAQQGLPRMTIGRYHVIREVARGGMGIVYEARDPSLQRSVALKMLKNEGDAHSFADRFRREAAVMAKLRHPNIVPVHEMGAVVDGAGDRRHFIVSDYIDGATLAETAPLLDRRARVRVLEIVAHAVAHVHSHGIVHRDLKFQNILMEEAPAGGPDELPWRIYLTDFGLARDLTADAVTHSGPVVGTAHAMAPEQARGQASRIGPWTDVWALGAMLYELACGAKPFPGTSAPEVYEKILRDDPIPPRKIDKSVPRDLETICLKALQKEPASRYDDAGAFADDLRRFLAGDPIRARHPGAILRLWKMVRRHPIAAALCLAFALVLAAVGVIVFRERERTESALQEVEWRRTVDDALRPAVVLLDRWELDGAPLSAEDRAVVDRAIRKADAIRPGAGPGRLEQGRRQWMNDDLAGAEEAFTAALADPPVKFLSHYYRARVRIERYSRHRLTSPALPYAGEVRVLYEKISPESPGDRALVAGALADLDEFRKRIGEEDQRTRLGCGLALRYRAGTAREFADAGTTLLEAAGQGGNVSRRLAFDAAGEAFYYAGDFDRAAGIHRSTVENMGENARTLFLLGLASIARGYRNYWAGRPSDGELTEAVNAFRRSAELNPSSPAARSNLGYARIQQGMVARASGKDPSSVLAAAIEDQTAAVNIAPRFTGAWNGRALARLELGLYQLSLGKDPSPDLDRAIADCRTALDIDPVYILALANRGNARLCLAQYRISIRQDPADLIVEAIGDQTRIIEIEPSYVDGWNDRGNARLLLAHITICRNEDAEPVLRDAVADFSRAIALNERYPYSWSNRGIARSMQVDFRRARNGDFAEPLRAAVEDFTQAITLKPNLAGAYFNRALLEVRDGRWAAAKADLEKAAELNPLLTTKCAPYIRQCKERMTKLGVETK